jgi:hypothetical protein
VSSGVADIPALERVLQDVASVSDFLEHARSALRTRWNDQQPINRLPQELMVYIFEHCCPTAYYLEQEHGGSASDIAYPRTVFAFSQICKGWRDLAFSAPVLWTTPIFNWSSSRSVVKMMTERAGTRPLYISSTLADITSTVTVIMAVRDSALFMAHIALAGTSEYMLDVVLTLRDEQRLPLLKKMSLDVDFLDIEDDGAMLFLSNNMLPKDAPHLRQLDLRGCVLSAQSPLYSHITDLYMSSSNMSSGQRFQDLIQILEHTPLLVNLHLTELYDPDMNPLPIEPVESSLHLPCLESLTLQDDTSFMFPLVRQLKFPGRTVVILMGDWEDRPTKHALEDLYFYLGEHYGEGENWRHLTLRYSADGFADLEVYTVEHQLDQWKEEDHAHACLLSVNMQLVKRTASSSAGFDDLVHVVTLQLPLSNLVSLSLGQSDHEVTAPIVRNLLLKLPMLRRLRARNAMLPQVIAALSPGSEVPAPMLETLRLDDALLVNQTKNPLPFDANVLFLNLVNLPELTELQRQRREAGCSIKHLIFVLCKCIISGENRTEVEQVRPYLATYMDGITRLELSREF